jgi:large subunit ribosomal protein L29
MKPTKPSDLRGLSDTELLNNIEQNERSLVDMKFKQAVGQLESTAAMRTVKRDIARMKTIIRERKLGLQR